MKTLNLEFGSKFGRYRVICPASPYIHPRGYSVAKVFCLCECGVFKSVLETSLVSGKTLSCGCLQKDSVTTHGKTKTREHSIWNCMLDRARNPNSDEYENYMGRGIDVIPEWETFENFLADMGECPEGASIHRLDNDKGYSKENCVWEFASVQNHVKRNWGMYAKGVSLKQNGKYEANIKKDGISYYLKQHLTEELAAKAYDDKAEELYGDRPNGTERQPISG